ncbi:hypothetical protein LCGC14_0416960 [marine sediment metagenome]|uniref:Uncharacterized protein n=1 Tax=marine sediment metagenome TaxID=412755 RepID=A0A0F9TA90_9ZZZZ
MVTTILNKPYRLNPKQVLLNLTIEGEPIACARPRLGKYGTYIPAKNQEYYDLVGWHIKNVYQGNIDTDACFGLRVIFFRSNRQRVDIDNLLKSIMDAITKVQVWGDDSQVREISGRLILADKNPRVEFVIYHTQDFSPVANCVHCGKPLRNSYPSKKTTYCSRECFFASRRVSRTCTFCRRVFTIAQSKTKQHPSLYCSRECNLKTIAQKRKANKTTAKCKTCGGPVSRKEYKHCLSCYLKSRKITSNYWKHRPQQLSKRDSGIHLGLN